ncbi:MAG: heme ABC transporter permease CcmC [Steroidobacteraceae bacterium]
MNWVWFHKLASPPSAYAFARILRPWLLWPALAMMGWAAYYGLFVVPPDYQQKDAYRIIFVHVPAASLSLLVYTMMAIAAGIGLIWRMKLAHAVAAACALPGTVFTVLALLTGAIWGRPMWGAWWAWDPRLTTELILLFLYLGYMALRASFDDVGRADRASAVLALVGVVNIPIIKYSVVWWNSLHQGQTLSVFGKSSIDASMVAPLLVMMLAFLLFFGAVLCAGLCAEILRRERNAQWLLKQVQ